MPQTQQRERRHRRLTAQANDRQTSCSAKQGHRAWLCQLIAHQVHLSCSNLESLRLFCQRPALPPSVNLKALQLFCQGPSFAPALSLHWKLDSSSTSDHLFAPTSSLHFFCTAPCSGKLPHQGELSIGGGRRRCAIAAPPFAVGAAAPIAAVSPRPGF